MKSRRFHPVLLAVAAVVPAMTARLAPAQVVTDGSLGPARNLTGPTYQITDDLGRRSGGNLFHSFTQFDLPTGGVAEFSSQSPGVTRVIARVTGGSPSQIDGTIRNTISNADTYLINPAGVVFGPNAALDVSGSFVASTADEIRHADGTTTFVDPSRNSSFSSAPVAAFGFTSATPGKITLGGAALVVPSKKDVAVIAGDVELTTAALNAPSGRVTIASVGGPDTVAFAVDDRDAMLSSNTGGRIDIASGSLVSTNTALTTDSSAPSGGAITIRGGDVTISGSLVAGTSDADADPARTISVGAFRTITLTRADDDGLAGQIQSVSGIGPGADVIVAAPTVVIQKGSAITSGAIDPTRDGPDIAVLARDLSIRGVGIDIENNREIPTGISGQSFQFAANTPPVRGGDIVVRADRVSLSAGGSIRTLSVGVGIGGDVNVTASQSIDVTGFASIATLAPVGIGGNVTVKARDMVLRDDGFVLASAVGVGVSGKIDITVSHDLTLTDNSGITSSGVPDDNTGTQDNAVGGSLTLTVGDTLTLRENSVISAATQTLGNAGSVEIGARVIEVYGGSGRARGQAVSKSRIAADSIADPNDASAGRGRGGDVTIAADYLALTDGAAISSTSGANGAGGSVAIDAARVRVTDESTITTETNTAAGGDISITGVTGELLLRRGEISASALNTGAAGSVTIGVPGGTVDVGGIRTGLTLQTLVASQSFSVAANSGPAGNVSITADTLRVRTGALVTSGTSGGGAGGDVSVAARDVILTGGGSELLTGIFAQSDFSEAGAGDAGRISVIATDKLMIRDNARISAITQGPGDAGTVRVQAGRIVIDARNQGPADDRATGVLSATTSTGAGGSVFVHAGDILLLGPGGFTSQTLDAGDAGTVRLFTSTLTSRGGQIVSSAPPASADVPTPGDAGGVTVRATGDITLDADSRVQVQAGQSTAGNTKLISAAGDVRITASRVQANSAGNGGRVTVFSRELILIDNSTVNAQAGAVGGSVFLGNGQVVIRQGSTINGTSAGTPVPVTIPSDALLLDRGSAILTDAPNFDLANQQVQKTDPPTATLQDTSALLQPLCGNRVVDVSSFVTQGRGGTPPTIGGFASPR